MAQDNFYPLGATLSIPAGSVSQAIQVKPLGQMLKVRLLASPAAVTFFLKFGTSNVQATASDTPFNGGAIEPFVMAGDQTHIAVYSPNGSVTLYITPGDYL